MRRIQIVAVIIGLAALSVGIAGCGKNGEAQMNDFLTTPVQRREVIVQVSATGTVEAIKVIEIKSKASGEILRIPIETGQVVKAGALLAQVDTTDVAAQVRQAAADFDVARARLALNARKKERSDDLLRQGMISQDEYDQAVLDYQTARASVIKTQTALDQARERFAETDVRAPSAGTILTKSVEEGQIIASAITQVSGGTTLMTMADLTRVQVRVLVDETDFGKIRPGQMATVTVDAYPNKKFHGSILKIEPAAVTQQSITFFPVIIEINNEEGFLKPGMSADVEIHVARRENVLTVSNEAVKTPRSAILTAPLLGLDPDTVSAILSASIRPPRSSANRAAQMRPRQRRKGARKAPNGGGVKPRESGIAVVFAERPTGIEPVVIRTGIQNWDYTEVVSGLKEGATVIIPPSAALAQQSQELRARARRWSGGRVMGRK